MPRAQAVVPPPDGGYPNFTTAEGQNALFSLTTGAANTAVGWFSLFTNAGGSFNTATGAGSLLFNTADQNTAFGTAALLFNTTGFQNTAVGTAALLNNTTGDGNTATGINALYSNTEGNFNTAIGGAALVSNTTGAGNTAIGSLALRANTTGGLNTATGFAALQNNTGESNTATGAGALSINTTGIRNTAVGVQALSSNTIGADNVAIGAQALVFNTDGDDNIALGKNAGFNLATGSGNIYIGNPGFDPAESDTTRIGNSQTRTFIAGISGVNEGGTISAVTINTNGQLGTQPPPSSRRFKKEIKPMEQVSEAILAFKPVTFHFKSDKSGTPQFGLIAEEVAEVNPDLVVRDEKGEIYSVRYEAVNAMLLNEFLKEHHKVQQLEANAARQQKQIEALTAGLQKVSALVETSRAAPQVVNNP